MFDGFGMDSGLEKLLTRLNRLEQRDEKNIDVSVDLSPALKILREFGKSDSSEKSLETETNPSLNKGSDVSNLLNSAGYSKITKWLRKGYEKALDLELKDPEVSKFMVFWVFRRLAKNNNKEEINAKIKSKRREQLSKIFGEDEEVILFGVKDIAFERFKEKLDHEITNQNTWQTTKNNLISTFAGWASKIKETTQSLYQEFSTRDFYKLETVYPQIQEPGSVEVADSLFDPDLDTDPGEFKSITGKLPGLERMEEVLNNQKESPNTNLPDLFLRPKHSNFHERLKGFLLENPSQNILPEESGVLATKNIPFAERLDLGTPKAVEIEQEKLEKPTGQGTEIELETELQKAEKDFIHFYSSRLAHEAGKISKEKALGNTFKGLMHPPYPYTENSENQKYKEEELAVQTLNEALKKGLEVNYIKNGQVIEVASFGFSEKVKGLYIVAKNPNITYFLNKQLTIDKITEFEVLPILPINSQEKPQETSDEIREVIYVEPNEPEQTPLKIEGLGKESTQEPLTNIAEIEPQKEGIGELLERAKRQAYELRLKFIPSAIAVIFTTLPGFAAFKVTGEYLQNQKVQQVQETLQAKSTQKLVSKIQENQKFSFEGDGKVWPIVEKTKR